MVATGTCPTLDDLAAFFDGLLLGEERDRMVRHLSECPTCVEVYALVAQMNEEPEAPVEQIARSALQGLAREMREVPVASMRAAGSFGQHATAWSPDSNSFMSGEKVFAAHLTTIEAIIRSVCRRHRMSMQEGEDFSSEVKLRLIENDFHILRAWEGRKEASIKSFLTAVITRMRLDFVRQLTGKYRSSEAAKALGPYAVELETLLVRDGRTFREAFEQLKLRFPEVRSAKAEAIGARLPSRSMRRMEGEGAVADLPDPGANAETHALGRERAAREMQVLAILDEARGRLAEEDQLIVKLLVDDGWKIGKIADHLKREAKPLYRHIQRIWDELRDTLERNGFDREDLLDALKNEGREELDDEELRNR